MTIPEFRIFDSHFHIISSHFPLVPNDNFVPDYFSIDDYMYKMASYNLAGGAVISGSFQGFDQTYLISALEKLGPDFVGITQLPVSVTDEEIIQLKKLGVRGLRINLKRGEYEYTENLKILATRVYELAGWHLELYLDSTMLSNLYPLLVTLPKVSIDHLGLSNTGFKYLLKLVEQGIHVKASGFGRVNLNVTKTLKKIHAINPSALMFGTDLPSTRAARPFCHNDYLLIIDTLDESGAKRVFYDNAIEFYNIPEKSD